MSWIFCFTFCEDTDEHKWMHEQEQPRERCAGVGEDQRLADNPLGATPGPKFAKLPMSFRSQVGWQSTRDREPNPYLNRVAGLHVQGDGLAGQGLDEDLHGLAWLGLEFWFVMLFSALMKVI